MIWLVIGIVTMFILLFSGIWLGSAFGISTLVSLFPLLGDKLLNLIGTMAWGSTAQAWVLIALPLFIFLGEFLFHSGIMGKLYDGLAVLMPRFIKGSLLYVVIITSAVFGALCGSSTAGAATIGRLAYADLTKRGYNNRITLGSIASGGTLAILIPPSLTFILYGFLTETSIAKLFFAGIIPGVILASLLALALTVQIMLKPSLVPKEAKERFSVKERLSAFGKVLPFGALIIAILGSIYSGMATSTEAASIGVVGAILLAAGYKAVNFKIMRQSAVNTVITSSFIFFIIIAAAMMQSALAYYSIKTLVVDFVAIFPSRLTLYIGIMVLYFVLGMILDPTGVTLLTIPFVYPVIVTAGFDPIWFGVVFAIQMELAMLTPPVGMNLYVLLGVTRTKFEDVAIGAIPFLIPCLLMLVVLYLFPQLATWIPSMM